ncbi:hypothetical protein IWZ03DRAFT_430535, partial [Phyllosticta citriasiana]
FQCFLSRRPPAVLIVRLTARKVPTLWTSTPAPWPTCRYLSIDHVFHVFCQTRQSPSSAMRHFVPMRLNPLPPPAPSPYPVRFDWSKPRILPNVISVSLAVDETTAAVAMTYAECRRAKPGSDGNANHLTTTNPSDSERAITASAADLSALGKGSSSYTNDAFRVFSFALLSRTVRSVQLFFPYGSNVYQPSESCSSHCG